MAAQAHARDAEDVFRLELAQLALVEKQPLLLSDDACRCFTQKVMPASLSYNALTLFVLSLLSSCDGLGPFAGAWLTANPARKYSPAEIGMLNAFQQALMTAMQPLLGSVIDRCAQKRVLLGIGALCVGAGVLVTIYATRFFSLLWATQLPLAFGLTVVPLALCSITLGLTPSENFTRQVALNYVGAHIGIIFSGIAMALCDQHPPSLQSFGQNHPSSPRWGLVPPACSVLCVFALRLLRHQEIDHERAAGVKHSARGQLSCSAGMKALLHQRVFCRWLALNFTFNVANMAQLQILVERGAALMPDEAVTFTSAAQILAHVLMTASCFVVGRWADTCGRRPMLITACGVVSVRALLTGAVDAWWIARGGSPWLALFACQGLDGAGAGLWSVMCVLVVKDIASGTGCFNLSMGCSQAVFSVGAVVSSFAAGQIASAAGFASAFLALGAVGVAATAQAVAFPETHGSKELDVLGQLRGVDGFDGL